MGMGVFSSVLELVSSLLVIIGVFLVCVPKASGLWVLVFGQVGWCAFAVINDQYFFLVQGVFLTLFNFWGIRNWKRDGIG